MRAANRQWKSTKLTLLVVSTAALTSIPNALLAASYGVAEVKPFGVLDVGASLSIRYLLDENDRISESATTVENRTTWEQELFLDTRSYVYHPGFLNMELGGGPLLVQQSVSTESESASNNEALFNFVARANFLDLKSYPFSVYYRRTHPSITTSLAGRFLTRSDEYGFQGSHSGLFEGSGLKVDLKHRDNEGSGFGTIVDESFDRAFFGWQTGYRRNDQITIEHDRVTTDSLSGSTGLPIQESTNEHITTSVVSRNSFGDDDQVRLNQKLIRLQQETRRTTTTSESDNIRYTAGAQWQNSERVRSTLNYQFNDSERTGADAKSHNLKLGLANRVTENTQFNMFADHDDIRQTGFNLKRTGLGGGASHSRSIGIGTLSISGFVRQERNDQESQSDTIRVFDEPITLAGTTPVDLANEFVVASSVIVTNVAGTQVFVENVDYRLIVVGSITSIQRSIDGNIFDGQTVLVDYEYLTSGTAEFDRFSTTVSTSLDFLDIGYARLGYGSTDSNVLSGQLTTPINDTEYLELVLGADFPIGRRWQFGGEYRHLDQDEDIAPFVRDSFAVNASAHLYGSFRLSLSASWVEVDQKESIEDVDQVNYRLGIRGVPFGSAQVAYDAFYEEDVGGSLPRELLQHRFSIYGQYRLVRYELRAIISEEKLGLTQRDYTQITAYVTRFF
jgi:hypothetical protein